MIAIILRWHQTISWKLGFGHGKEGRAYHCPWWANEALYALAYTCRRCPEIQAIQEAPTVHLFSGKIH